MRRALTNNAEVLVRGERRPLIGTVSMDNVTLDIGTPPAAAIGDDAVLIGAQGDERITAEELARRLGTINYEITCGLLPRVAREYHRDGEPVDRGGGLAGTSGAGSGRHRPVTSGSGSGHQPPAPPQPSAAALDPTTNEP